MTARTSTTPAAPTCVRRATADDLEHLVSLFDAYRRFYGQDADTDLAREFLAERLARSESCILLATGEADRGGSAVGFAQLYPTFSSIRCRRTLVLNDLFVAPAHRSRGIGLALLDHARRFATLLGAASISLQTATDNRRAQALYERFGFVRDERFFGYVFALA